MIWALIGCILIFGIGISYFLSFLDKKDYNKERDIVYKLKDEFLKDQEQETYEISFITDENQVYSTGPIQSKFLIEPGIYNEFYYRKLLSKKLCEDLINNKNTAVFEINNNGEKIFIPKSKIKMYKINKVKINNETA